MSQSSTDPLSGSTQHTGTTVGTATCPSAGPGESDTPDVVSLFNILGAEHQYLPYDPDAVCREILNGDSDAEEIIDADEMAELVKRSVGIDFPNQVREQAQRELSEQYNPSEINVLLHLMQCHGQLISDGVVHPEDGVTVGAHPETTEINRTFIIVRTLRVRTERAMTHLGTTLKGVIMHSKTRAKSLFNSNRQ